MKIFIPFISLLLVLTTLKTQAQNRVEYGVKGGYTLSAIRSKDRESNSIDYSGFTLGGYTKFLLQNTLVFNLKFYLL